MPNPRYVRPYRRIGASADALACRKNTRTRPVACIDQFFCPFDVLSENTVHVTPVAPPLFPRSHTRCSDLVS